MKPEPLTRKDLGVINNDRISIECCGSCDRMEAEDTAGRGWCSFKECEVTCDDYCGEWEGSNE